LRTEDTCIVHDKGWEFMFRYLGPDYGDERKGPSEAVAAAQIPYLAKESFPLCMQASFC